jgi:hypothetical protein
LFSNRIISIVIFLFVTLELHSQVEFFQDSSGLSLQSQFAFLSEGTSGSAYGFMGYFKSGIAAGIAVETVKDQVGPVISVGFYGKEKFEERLARPVFSLSFGAADGYNMAALDAGMLRCFFRESQFTFSLSFWFSIQAAFGFGGGAIDFLPVWGINYTQTFFSKRPVYPLVGFGWASAFSENIHIYSLQLGLNFRLGK